MSPETQQLIKSVGLMAGKIAKESADLRLRAQRLRDDVSEPEQRERAQKIVQQLREQEDRALWLMDQLTVIALEASVDATMPLRPLVLANGGTAA